MKRPPRRTDENLFAGGTGYHIVWMGLLMAFLTLGSQAWSLHLENSRWQTIVFTVLSLAQLGHVWAISSDQDFIYKKGLFANRQLSGAIFITFLLQMGVIYLPFANEIFKTEPLSASELLFCIAVAAIIFHAVEFEKWLRWKKPARRKT